MKSNISSYVTASIVSHLLLLGFLYFTQPPEDAAPPIFSVDIVTPDEGSQLPQPQPQQKPPERVVQEKQPLIIEKDRLDPSEMKLPPETLYGGEAGAKEEDSADPPAPEPSGTEKEQLARKDDDISFLSPSEEDDPSKTGEGSSRLAPHSSLFDKGTIEKFAKKGTKKPEQKGLSFDTSEFKNRGYMRLLKERIESVWKYPREAARQGLSGDLYMKFVIKKNGMLAEVELIRTSGYRELDEAAMKAVRRAQPFWPLPEDYEKDTLEIKGHFIYVYGNTLVL